MVWSLGDKLITQLGFFAVTLYLAKLIGPESFGLIGMLAIFTLLADSVVNNGFSQALVQRSQSLTDKDNSTIFYVNLLWGAVSYVALYLSAPLIADFYREPALVDIARLLFLTIIINSFSVIVRAQLLIKVDFKSQAIAGLVSTIGSSTVGIYLAVAGYDYWAFVWLLLTRSLVQSICLWFSSQWRPRLVFSMNSFQSLFKFGSNLMLAGFVATIVNNLYVVLIGRYFNAVNVGYFTQATTLTNFLSQLISSTLQGVTYPMLTSIKEQRSLLVNLYKQLIAVTMLFSLPALVGFAAVADSFVALFLGEEWLPTVPIIQILCFARAITPISTINMSILNAVGRSDLFLKVDLSKLPMTLAALFVSVPYGIEAVSWAMLTTSIVAYFFNAYYPGKLFGFGAWEQLKIARNYIFSASIMFFTVRVIAFESLWLDLLAGIALGALVYFSVLWLLKDAILNRVISELATALTRRIK